MRVVVTDDHRIVREGIRWMLSDEPAIEIVAEAESGDALLALLETVQTDVVLLDIRMPGKSGLDTLEEIRRSMPDLPVLMLTMYEDTQLVHRAVQLGADGYLPKSATRGDLITAILTVGRGGGYLHGSLTQSLVRTLVENDPSRELTLSPDELGALQLVARGASNKEIAIRTGMAGPAVKACLHRVFTMLGARTRSEAVAIALRLGLID